METMVHACVDEAVFEHLGHHHLGLAREDGGGEGKDELDGAH